MFIFLFIFYLKNKFFYFKKNGVEKHRFLPDIKTQNRSHRNCCHHLTYSLKDFDSVQSGLEAAEPEAARLDFGQSELEAVERAGLVVSTRFYPPLESQFQEELDYCLEEVRS